MARNLDSRCVLDQHLSAGASTLCVGASTLGVGALGVGASTFGVGALGVGAKTRLESSVKKF